MVQSLSRGTHIHSADQKNVLVLTKPEGSLPCPHIMLVSHLNFE